MFGDISISAQKLDQIERNILITNLARQPQKKFRDKSDFCIKNSLKRKKIGILYRFLQFGSFFYGN